MDSVDRLSQIALLLIMVALSGMPGVAGGTPQPRLLFGESDIPSLRQNKEREPFASMYEAIEQQAGMAGDFIPQYIPGHRGVYCAFLYVLTGDVAWEQKAREHVEEVFSFNQWATNVNGLRLYMHGKSVALIYDMCKDAWPQEFGVLVSQKLKEQAHYIFYHGGHSQNNNRASNWQGARFASAGLCYLATDETIDTNRIYDAYDSVSLYFESNVTNHPETRGWNLEDLGYTYFVFGEYIGPFGVAMRRFDQNKDIRKDQTGV